jgi:hypothetical protein
MLQPPKGTTCGTPAKVEPVRYTLAMQWPFDMCGDQDLKSAMVFDTEHAYFLDLAPYFKRLSDLQGFRDGKTDISDFWTDAENHLKLPYIHHPRYRLVKAALSACWQKFTDSPFPPYTGYVFIHVCF